MAATIVSSSRLNCQSYLRFLLSQCNRRVLSTKVCRQKHPSRLRATAAYCGCRSQGLSTHDRHVNLQVPSLELLTFRNFHIGQSLYDVTVLKTPGFPESVSEGDIRWEKAVGDSVTEDEVVGEIETDKTAIEVRAPMAGVISELLVPDGEKVVAGQDIYKLTTGEGAAPSATPPAEQAPPTKQAPPTEQAPPPPPPPSQSPTAGPIPTTPPPVPPIPTQPISSKPVSQVPVTPAKPAPTTPTTAPVTPGVRTETRTKMNRMRQRIAQRLMDAKDTYAMLTTFNEIDMTNVMEMRTKYKDAFMKKYGLKLGFMSAFLKASAYALEDQPVVNAVIDDLEIVYRDFIDISVAVATPKGLVVPVLRDVGSMNYADIEKGLMDLGEKARSGNLAIEDMDGGTFTVSNGGVFGSLMGTPIINPPQSAILGMHGIFDRPVAVQGKVEVRPMMYVALTYDHRLIDGREAVTFLRKIKSAVEDPRSMLLAL